MITSSAVGGGVLGLLGTQMDSFAFNSVLTIPAYSPIPQYVLGISVAFIMATVLTYIFGLGEQPKEGAEASEAGAPVDESAVDQGC